MSRDIIESNKVNGKKLFIQNTPIVSDTDLLQAEMQLNKVGILSPDGSGGGLK